MNHLSRPRPAGEWLLLNLIFEPPADIYGPELAELYAKIQRGYGQYADMFRLPYGPMNRNQRISNWDGHTYLADFGRPHPRPRWQRLDDDFPADPDYRVFHQSIMKTFRFPVPDSMTITINRLVTESPCIRWYRLVPTCRLVQVWGVLKTIYT